MDGIIIYGDTKVDFLVYTDASKTGGDFTGDAKNAMFSDAYLGTVLTWATFPTALLFCPYEDSITSSRAGFGDIITGYEITRTEPQDSYERTIGVFDIGECPYTYTDSGNKVFYAYDYGARNNVQYTYHVYPLSVNAVNPAYSSTIITDWEGFGVYPLKVIDNGQYRLVDTQENEETPTVESWIFGLNFSEEAFTLNQDKTVFATFSRFPKVSIGQSNYYTGGLSCYLGDILCNGKYYEPKVKMDKWEKFIRDNGIFLYKDLKGDCYVVVLDSSPTKQHDNLIANRNIYEGYDTDGNSASYITANPTTIQFRFTEIAENTYPNVMVVGR